MSESRLLREAIEVLRDENEGLRRQLQEAQKDSARLDVLDKELTLRIADGRLVGVCRQENPSVSGRNCIRADIDAYAQMWNDWKALCRRLAAEAAAGDSGRVLVHCWVCGEAMSVIASGFEPDRRYVHARCSLPGAKKKD